MRAWEVLFAMTREDRDGEAHWEVRQVGAINERHIRQTATSVKSHWAIRVTR